MRISDVGTLFIIEKDSLKLYESLKDFNLQYRLSTLSIPDKTLFLKWLQNISPRDVFHLEVIIGNNLPITLINVSKIDDFISKISEEIKYIENEQIVLKLHVSKVKDNNVISVYCLERFAMFLTTLPLHNLLKLFMEELENSPGILFELFEDYAPFGSSNIYFGKKSQKRDFIDQKEITNNIRENCHFGNFEEFKFNPNYFNLIDTNEEFIDLNRLLDKLTLLFSIVSIFDITSLDGASLSYRLVGYKVINGSLRFEDMELDLKDNYFQIFNWVYSEKSKVTDKIGLARNILSLSLIPNSINIDENVFISIISGYQIYQKENINRYIEIRSKITDQLLILSGNASQVINNYVDNFKKSLFAFLSFFISVLVIRVLTNGNFQDVLTTDATILSLAFLFISVLFLFFSLWEFSKEIGRLKEDYANLKDRFTDLLNEKDINRILNNDKDFNTHLTFIEKKKKSYTILWITVLLVFLIVIFTISTYVNWNTSWQFLKSLNIK